MNDQEALQKIIASYCPVPYQDVDLSDYIKDRYVIAEQKEPFCDDICIKWQLKNSKCTSLHNKMFDSISTGNDILNFIGV